MIQDDFSFRDSFCWEESVLSLRNMGMRKQLQTLEESIQNKLRNLEKDPGLNKEMIEQEKAILSTVQKEIRRLERVTFYAQLGELNLNVVGSSRQGCNPAGERPAMTIVRFSHVVIPQFWKATSSPLRGVNAPAARGT